MINTDINVNAIIEELGNSIAALTIENSVLKARIKLYEDILSNSEANSKPASAKK